MFVKLSNKEIIPVDDISIITAYEKTNIKRNIAERRKKDSTKIINFAGRKKILGVIFTKSGYVYLTNVAPITLLKRLDGLENIVRDYKEEEL